MTNFGTNSLNQHATGLIIPPWIIIGKKTDVSSEYEDLCLERKTIIHGPDFPWWEWDLYHY